MPKYKPEEPPLIYADSDVYLDLITKNKQPHLGTGEQRGRAAYELFRAVDEGRVKLAASSLVQAEVGANGESQKQTERIRMLLERWWTSPETIWREVDRHIARKAIELSIEWRGRGIGDSKMSAADATHLAVAVDLGCDFFFTYDHGFPHNQSVNGVQVMRPEVVWPQTLLDQAVGE
ncbi:PIN domain-containing protein [Nocardioides sp. CCNWLW239]|uniref:type II toxin-antitoxin system VapC family toxin n=1 Tax=Nocardioides sp. CCNWLW239 TaxID=3128902 RepID=UPI0030161E00